ncbi:MAG: Flp pilus assembly complex ATPase component TadA, partial [Actinomycetales bacterium]|nr:Flp pilus assembly complex ATPase component TadA [Actinomycetales bacterium]
MKLRDRANQVRSQIVSLAAPSSPAEIARIVHSEFPLLTNDEKLHLLETVVTGIAGLGPLENLSKKPGVTDILVNGPSDVWYVNGSGLHHCDIGWESEAELREFATHLANQVNRRLDEAQPFLELQLPNGMRVHAIIPPLSPKGTCISIRIPQAQLLTLAELRSAKMLNQEALGVL